MKSKQKKVQVKAWAKKGYAVVSKNGSVLFAGSELSKGEAEKVIEESALGERVWKLVKCTIHYSISK